MSDDDLSCRKSDPRAERGYPDLNKCDAPIMTVPVSSLLPADSPRTCGENRSHIKLMASVTGLPPIVVHRQTMRVIDGMHRLEAAKLRNEETIDVRFFDGTIDEAFVFAVAANVTHGMPLSLTDRKTAAIRILDIYPHWSDRKIGEMAGLSHRTVATLRRRSTGQVAQLNCRLGKDGKVHPLASGRGRQIAADLIRADEGKPLREVAQKSGISAATAADVRSRLQRGDDPVPANQISDPQTAATNGGVSLESRFDRRRRSSVGAHTLTAQSSADNALGLLRKDPALRFTTDGKALIRLLTMSFVAIRDCERLTVEAPAHCQGTIEDLASVIGDSWKSLAARLQSRMRLDAEHCG
ncbi:ParB/RepB/Spo0J family partition protein [Mycobacterium haemophilum]|uniref:ParB/RepB/Spo0J family partition protein n=1 Tax=Mycobacterium haemophilum TaxID=29311 RepID=UPI0018CD49AD|nr:ParB N-terminal domain-containing protein [Mycobacterium haemophilum]